VTGPATRLLLEIDVGDDPVRGRIGMSELELTPFEGWTELAAAIERHRSRRDQRGNGSGEGGREVVEQVIDRLDAHRQADEIGRHLER